MIFSVLHDLLRVSWYSYFSCNSSVVEAQEPFYAQNVTFIKDSGRVPTVRHSQSSDNSTILLDFHDFRCVAWLAQSFMISLLFLNSPRCGGPGAI
jgi:hypothetical protein